jgi:hypothetical protein
MRPVGFSTGALAYGDFRRALKLLRPRRLPVLEVSALRDHELPPLLDALDTLDLSGYSYLSLHAPSAFTTLAEQNVSALLRRVLPRSWPIIMHPDALKDHSLWRGFGAALCIENMDKRKPIGRNVRELEAVFAAFPDASFCFDIGHARQVDPTMSEAAFILQRFGERLKQVHISEVNTRSQHEAISFTALQAFRSVAHLIPRDVPIILETIVSEQHRIDEQLRLAQAALTVPEAALL